MNYEGAMSGLYGDELLFNYLGFVFVCMLRVLTCNFEQKKGRDL